MGGQIFSQSKGADMTGIGDHLNLELNREGTWDNPSIRI